MCKEYKYQGETFSISKVEICKLQVSNGIHTLNITLSTIGPGTYSVPTVAGHLSLYADSAKEAVDRACQNLIEAKAFVKPEQACKELMDFVEAL